MKSVRFSLILPTISLLLAILLGTAPAKACGPYYPLIPTPTYFSFSSTDENRNDANDRENLELWQKLTSKKIPLTDIKLAVYYMSLDELEEDRYGRKPSRNEFLSYLRNTRDSEIADFLMMAKTVEETREKRHSPWYYPASRDSARNEFSIIIQQLKDYKGSRLADRYALQVVRAYFGGEQYRQCVEYYDSAFAQYPDSNLFKRMSQGYVAGSLLRLGDTIKANEYFIKAGDFRSLRGKDAPMMMAKANPDCAELKAYAVECATDTAKFRALLPVVKAALKNSKTKYKGDWEFCLAYLYGDFLGKPAEARKHILKAEKLEFSSDEIRDKARAYRMLTDAVAGDESRFADDIAWISDKIDPANSGAGEWERILKNIVYAQWVPSYWRQSRYTDAVLLCGYADNILGQTRRQPLVTSSNYNWSQNTSLANVRRSDQLLNFNDYSNLSFRLMNSLSSEQLAQVMRNIQDATGLRAKFVKTARTDADYINEIIGTLALREENYDRAVEYLSKVSTDYQRSMNIYKGGYLSRDPFIPYPKRWSNEDDDIWRFEHGSGIYRKKPVDSDNAKLRFARQMQKLQKEMGSDDADRRGLAALRYAIGRRNSLEECWALTQYWRGFIGHLIQPGLQYWDEAKYPGLAFLYEYGYSDSNAAEKRYSQDIDDALAMLATDEARAQAQYLLGNVKTVIKLYADTKTGKKVKTSCDRWRQWL